MAEERESLREKERLYNFLKKYDLHQYHDKFLVKGVHRLSHLKDVCADEGSMEEIGLSRIERQRLKKKVKENVALRGRIMKKIIGKDKQFDAPIPEVVRKASSAPEKTGRRSAAIIPKDEIKVLRKIGEGAYGSVNEGTWSDVHGAVTVAIKTLYSRQAVQDQFIKEANSMASLNHHHIIQLYGVVLDQPLMLVEELAPFGSLLEYLHKEGPHLTLHLFHTYACQIADAMAYLETRRVVHRDLAIRNILLAQIDYVKLSDFGMARVLDDNSEVYNLSNLATKIPIAWTAPEAITQAKFSSASDAWSYGVTMWEVYSLGKVPWKGLSPIEIRDLIVGGERLGRPERCPSDVFRLVQTCWKDNPQDRPSFADIYNRIQQLVPRQVRAIKAHNVMEDPNTLSFKTGDLVYVIDRPSKEWITGMTVDGTVGHCRSEFVSDLIKPLDDIRAKLAAGKTNVSDLSIGHPTDVDHMIHYNQDGSKWVSENAHAIDLDATPPASPGRGKGHSGSRSGSESNPLPFTVIDTRSPSPKGSVMSPKSPLVSKLSTSSTTSPPPPARGSRFEPLPYTDPTPSLMIDPQLVGTTEVPPPVEPRPLSMNLPHPQGVQSTSQDLLTGDLQCLDLQTPDNQYVSMTRMPPGHNQLTQQLAAGGANESDSPDTNDPYVHMRSVTVHDQRDAAASRTSNAWEVRRSASSAGHLGNRSPRSSGVEVGRRHSSPIRSRVLSETLPSVSEQSDDDIFEERSAYVKHSVNGLRGSAETDSSAENGWTRNSGSNGASNSPVCYDGSAKSPAQPCLSSATASNDSVGRVVSTNTHTPISLSYSLPSAAAHYDVPRSFRPAESSTSSAAPSHTSDTSLTPSGRPLSLLDMPNASDNVDTTLPEPLVPISTPSPVKSRRSTNPFSSSPPVGERYVFSEDVMTTSTPSANTEEAIVPQATRFLYTSPNAATDKTTSSWSNMGTRPTANRPVPKPRTGSAKNGDSIRKIVSKTANATPPIPSRHRTSVPDTSVSPQPQRGRYERVDPKTLTTDTNNYTFIDPSTRTQNPFSTVGPASSAASSSVDDGYQVLSPTTRLATSEYTQVSKSQRAHGQAGNSNLADDNYEHLNPRAARGSTSNGKTKKTSVTRTPPPSTKSKGRGSLRSTPRVDKEDLLEGILVDDEFSGCDIEICRFSLEQCEYDVESAKEEIRVQILLGMMLPNIREADCRRALVHCQHKTDRAAAWLLQMCDEIQRREQ